MAGLADYLFGGSTPVYQGPVPNTAPALGAEVAGMSPSIGAAITNRLPTMMENIARAYAGTLPDTRSRPVAQPVAAAQPVAQPIAVQPQALPSSNFSAALAGAPVKTLNTHLVIASAPAPSASTAPQGLSLRQALALHQLMKPQLTPAEQAADALRTRYESQFAYDRAKGDPNAGMNYEARMKGLLPSYGVNHEILYGGGLPATR